MVEQLARGEVGEAVGGLERQGRVHEVKDRLWQSPGSISDEAIARIATGVPPPVSSFLLTSEGKAEAISAYIRRARPTTVQIVSHIDSAESAELAEREPWIRRVQVIHVEALSCLDLIDVYAPYIHAFLLDSGRPNAATPELGGTGRPHDWSVSRRFVELSPLPVFLAGGLNADNVSSAIKMVMPFEADICSGVRRDGHLDRAKLRQFCGAVHAVDYASI